MFSLTQACCEPKYSGRKEHTINEVTFLILPLKHTINEVIFLLLLLKHTTIYPTTYQTKVKKNSRVAEVVEVEEYFGEGPCAR